MSITKIEACRVCSNTFLTPLIDLGEPALCGQFIKPDDHDPMRSPIQVVRCLDCGVLQMKHSVSEAKVHFERYFYQSSVSATMRAHLKALVLEASDMLEEKVAPRVLGIASNDGYELDCIPFGTGQRVLIDPSDVPVAYPGIQKITGFFPQDFLLTQEFDLILSIACYYSVDNPVGFAKSVKKILSDKGLWVCEVANQEDVIKNNALDFFCNEHVFLPSPLTMDRIAKMCDLRIIRVEPSKSNGGSMRYYLTHTRTNHYRERTEWTNCVSEQWSRATALNENADLFSIFASQVSLARSNLRDVVSRELESGGKVHLLGASTKSGLLLQYANLDHRHIGAASDRDPRKVGLVMPGTRIRIVEESESRAMKPTLYLSILPFKDELIAREREAGNHTPICFCLPQPEIVVP